MGHHSLGDTSAAVAGSATDSSASGVFWIGDHDLTAPAEAWIDSIWYWIGASAADRTIQGACYGTTGVQFGGATLTGSMTLATGVVFHGVLYSLNSGNNNGGGNSPYLHVNSGDGFRPGMWSSGSGSTLGLGSDAGSYYAQRVASVPGVSTGTTQNLDGNPVGGKTHYYVQYWDKCAVYSVPTTQQYIGSVFQITGTSFNAGMNNVYIGTVPVTTYSIDSDTQMSLTVPSGAVSGTVNLDSKAGNVFSAGTVQIGPGGWFKSGGTIHRLLYGYYKYQGVLHPLTVSYKSGGTPHQTF